MPITPRFELTQDDEHIILTLRIPYIRPSSSELYVDESNQTDVSFYCSPYLLKLRLPHPVQTTLSSDLLSSSNDDNNYAYQAVYDPNVHNGTMTIRLVKETEGQFFEDLDLLTKFLMPVLDDVSNLDDKVKKRPMITVLDRVDGDNNVDDDDDAETISDNSNNSSVVPNLLEEIASSTCSSHYGFLNRYSNVFQGWNNGNSRTDSYAYLQKEMSVEIPEPDSVPDDQRRALRLEHENDIFDAERYLGDFFGAKEDMIFQMAKDMEDVHWERRSVNKEKSEEANDEIADLSYRLDNLTTDDQSHRSGGVFESTQSFTQGEQDILSRLSHKKFNDISDNEKYKMFLSLADIMFAYAYDHITTGGDPSPESAWTIAILSPTLSWFEQYTLNDKPMKSIVYSMQRSLIYPYLRYWPLAEIVARHVSQIFLGGRRVLLRCLLQTYRILEKTDTHYLLNKLYIHDFCVWIQQVTDSELSDFANTLSKDIQLIRKSNVDLELLPLESYALEANDADNSSSEDESYIDGFSDENSSNNSNEHALIQEFNNCEESKEI